MDVDILGIAFIGYHLCCLACVDALASGGTLEVADHFGWCPLCRIVVHEFRP